MGMGQIDWMGQVGGPYDKYGLYGPYGPDGLYTVFPHMDRNYSFLNLEIVTNSNSCCNVSIFT